MSDSSDSDRTEQFLRLLTENERRLAIYVTGLISCPQDAQDILQEGKIVMWRHFDQFELGTNFAAWARRILFHQILAWRRRAKRQPSEMLTEKVLVMLRDEAESAARERHWQRREKALARCVESLPREHREVLDLRYRDEASIEAISHRTDRTEGAVYRLLSRIRKLLFDCVERELGSSS